MIRVALRIAALIAFGAASVASGFCQATALLEQALKQNVGLTQQEIDSIRNGQAFAKALPSRSPSEVFVFGAVFINAEPASYLKYAYDFNRLGKTPGYLAIQQISTPPKLADLRGFVFDAEDVQALKSCTPGNCAIQLPGSTIDNLKKSINWSAPNVNDQVNQFIQNQAVSRLDQYQAQGDHIFGAVYNDKEQQVKVADQFAYILSYAKDLQQNVPQLYNYVLDYPQSGAPNLSSMLYWDSVKFGLKPTLRIVQVLTMQGTSAQQPAYAIAEKQLYSSHYFETALDLTYCINASGNPNQSGFFLVQVMGSEQAGLTGFKGSMLRRIAVSHSVTAMQKSLQQTKSALEHHQD